MNRAIVASAALLALLLLVPAIAAAPPQIVPREPLPDGIVRTRAPLLRVDVVDVDGDADFATLRIILDGLDLAEVDPEGFTVNATGASYRVPSILPLSLGNHTLRVTVADAAGEQSDRTYNFTIDLSAPPSTGGGLSLSTVLAMAGVALILGVAGAAAAYAYANKTRRFTFRRHFLKNPEQVRLLALYVPVGVAVLGTMAGLFIMASLPSPPRFGAEQVLVAGAVVGFAPFGIDSLRRTKRTQAAEHAFSAFLFELADAVRGGIDPMKAVLEMAKTGDGLLKKNIQRAADAIRLGRPLPDALRQMTADLGSSLVSRYAALVGEASEAGGNIGGVIQRAARDMEEMLKVREERDRQMTTPMVVMYMAFGILLIMLVQLVPFASSLTAGLPNFVAGGGLPGGEADSAAGPSCPPGFKLSDEPGRLQGLMFHLILLNAVAGGLLVGSFRAGKLRHGILHAIAMVVVAATVYPLLV